MNIRKNLVLIVSGGVFLVAAVAMIVLLASLISRFHRVSTNLSEERRKFEGLVGQKVFPSRTNIVLMQANVEVTAQHFKDTLTDFAKDCYEAPAIEPAQFPIHLTETINRLNLLAISNNCLTDASFYYGFDRYAKSLPKREDIPRLARQLHFASQISSLLFKLRVSRLDKIERQLFEATGADDGMGGGPDAGALAALRDADLDPSGLFRREKYTVRYMAREDRVWDVMEELSASSTFLSLARIEFVNPNLLTPAGTRELQAPAPGPAPLGLELPPAMPVEPAATTNRPPPHDQRVMAGRNELVVVQMDVWAYNFIVPVSAGATNGVTAAAPAADKELQP